jgi:hypothetical protein
VDEIPERRLCEKGSREKGVGKEEGGETVSFFILPHFLLPTPYSLPRLPLTIT